MLKFFSSTVIALIVGCSLAGCASDKMSVPMSDTPFWRSVADKGE